MTLKKNNLFEEVSYYCPKCEMTFVVYHKKLDPRLQFCGWCCGRAQLTGKISKLEGNEVVTYQDDKEIGRRHVSK